MKVVFHDRYRESYYNDPAAAPNRLNKAENVLRETFEFVKPDPAAEDDILLVHSINMIERIKGRVQLYELALLAAGGAIKAAELAVGGEPAFALIRPPGHHASRDTCWGFCWFNNVAVAVEKMKRSGKINSALIVDIDLHFGDGTSNIYGGSTWVKYHHLWEIEYLKQYLTSIKSCDLVAISAGFDRHVQDWGGMLTTQDYYTLGQIIGAFAAKVCGGRVFGVLEGGYNYDALAESVKALLTGLQEHQ